MPTPTELALSSLLPTFSYLPPDLISLANSLLSQSRAKAGSLKSEEEIARTYACAHIACRRLEKRLELEIGKPAPPVKPRVYEKLLKYLDGVLVTTRTAPRTPQTTRVKDAVGNRTASGKKQDVTSSKSQVKTPTTSARKRTRDEVEKTEEQKSAPDFAMPLTRAICKSNGIASAAPHVLVGAGAVIAEILQRARQASEGPASKRRRKTPQSAKSTTMPEEGIAMSKWPALIVALSLFTAARMKGLDVEDEKIKDMRRKGVEAVEAFMEDKKAALPAELSEGLEKLDSNISFYVLEAEESGWLDMEWYHNVPQYAVQDAEIGESEQDEDHEELITPKKRPYKTPLRRKEKHGGKAAVGLDDEPGAAGLLVGLRTMFQPAVDWLSEERREDYEEWKRGILEECRAVEMEA